MSTRYFVDHRLIFGSSYSIQWDDLMVTFIHHVVFTERDINDDNALDIVYNELSMLNFMMRTIGVMLIDDVYYGVCMSDNYSADIASENASPCIDPATCDEPVVSV